MAQTDHHHVVTQMRAYTFIPPPHKKNPKKKKKQKDLLENKIHCSFFFLLFQQLSPSSHNTLFGLAYHGKDIVFRFIIEYMVALRDFYRPLGNNNRSIYF